MHRNGKQRTSWTLRNRERKQEVRTRREGTTSISSLSTLLLPRGPPERGKHRESSAEVSRHRHLMNAQRGNPERRSAGTRGFDERSARIFNRTTEHSTTKDIRNLTHETTEQRNTKHATRVTQDKTRRHETGRDKTRREKTSTHLHMYTRIHMHIHLHIQIRLHMEKHKARPPDNIGPPPCVRIK